MALEKDQLTIDIEVNTKDATKDISNLSKQIDELNMALKNVDFDKINSKEVVSLNKEIENLNKTTSKTVKITQKSSSEMKVLSNEMASLSNNADRTSSAFRRIGDTVNNAAGFLSEMFRVLKFVSAAFKTFTDPANIRRLSDIANVLGNLLILRNAKFFGNKLKDASVKIDLFAGQVEDLSSDLRSLNGDLKDTAGTFTVLSNSIVKITSFISDISNIIHLASRALDTFTDPKKIRALAQIIDVLGNILILKGSAGFGNTLKDASGNIEDFAGVVEGSGDFIDDVTRKLDFWVRTLDILETTLQAATIGVAGMTGLLITNSLNLQKYNGVFKSTIGNINIFGRSLNDVSNQAIKVFSVGANGIGEVLRRMSMGFVTVRSSLRPTSLSMIELFTVISPLLINVGNDFRNSESAVKSFSGTLLVLVGFLTGAFSVAIGVILAKLGSFVQSVGIDIIQALDRYSEKAQKAALLTRQFSFTIESFSNVLGSNVIGTLDQWNAIVERISETTVFTSNDIRKSIKLLVSEGSTLGLQFVDNQKLLNDAIEIASANGRELNDVTQALLSGLAGQSQAAFSLGLNLRDSALSHSKYVKESQKTIDNLDEEGKVRARLSIITERANILQGIATEITKTAAGQSIRLSKAYDRVQESLGASNVVIETVNELYTRFIESLSIIPKPIFKIIAALGELAGIILTVTGFFTANLLVIAGLTTSYKFLNAVIGTNLVLSASLTDAFRTLNNILGIQTVAVVSLSTFFQNIFNAFKAIASLGIAGIFASISKSLAVLLVTFKNLFIILAPLILKIGLLVAAIIGLIKAFQELFGEVNFGAKAFIDALTPSSQLADNLKTGAKSADIFSRAFDILTETVTRTFTVLKSIASLIAAGLTAPILFLTKGVLVLRKAFADTTQEELAFDLAINDINKSLASLADQADVAIVGIATLGNEYDIANFKLDKFKQKANEPGTSENTGAEGIKEVSAELQNLFDQNRDLQLQLELIGLSQVESIRKRLTFDLQGIELAKARLAAQKEQTPEILAQIAALNKQAGILSKIAKADTGKLRLDTLEQIEKANEDINKQIELAGLKGEELAEKQLEIEIAKIDAKMDQLKAEGLLTEAAIKGLEERKKLLGDLQAKKSGGGEIGGGGGEDEGAGFGDALSSIGGAVSGIFDGIIGAFDNMVALAGSDDPFGLSSFNDTVLNLVDSLPQVITKIIDALPEIIDKIFASLDKLIAALPGIATKIFEALPELISQILDQLPNLIEGILVAIPQIIDSLIRAIPRVITNIIDRLPDILESLISGIIGALGEIAVSFIDEFIVKGGAFKIGIAIQKAFIFGIPIAIVKGIVNGLKRAFKAIFKGFKIPGIDTKPFENSVKDIVKSASKGAAKVAKEVFGFIDLPKAGDKLRDVQPVEEITNAIEIAGRNVSSLWDSFLAGLRTAWLWVWNHIILPIYDLVVAAFQWAWDKVILPLYDLVVAAFQWAWDKVILPLYDLVVAAFQWAWDKVILPLYDLVVAAFQWAWDKVILPLYDLVVAAFQWAWDKVILPLYDLVVGAFQWVWDEVILPIYNLVVGAFQWAWDNVILGIYNLVLAGFQWAWDNVILGIYNLVVAGFQWAWDNVILGIYNLVVAAFRWAWDNVLQPATVFIEQAFNIILKPFEALTKALNSFNPGDFLKDLTGGGGGGASGILGKVASPVTSAVSSVGKALGFAEGGLVNTVGFIETPGEFVFSKGAVDAIGPANLERMNTTRQMPNQNGKVININSGAIVINQVDGENSQDLADRVISEITRRTLDGEGIIFSGGIRAS